MDLSEVNKLLNGIESRMTTFAASAGEEIKAVGKVSVETKAALDAIGLKQRELADEIMMLKQRAGAPGPDSARPETMGQLFVKTAGYEAFVARTATKAHFEYKNTLTGSDATVEADRRPGIVGGALQPLTLEGFISKVPTSSSAIEFTRETAFTNNAAETAEGAVKPESVLTWALATMPVATVAHIIKISRQLAADAPALAAYVDERMRYGVDQRVETQLVSGDGISPNIKGFLTAGNYTAHGIADAGLGTVLKKLVLIRTMMANLTVAGFPPDAIVLNPMDWAAIEIMLFTTAAGQTMYSVSDSGQARLFGLPVIQSIGMPLDNVAVGNFKQAMTIYEREGMQVDMSESDGDNFSRNLITIRAERRLALVVERPASVRAGDLTPA